MSFPADGFNPRPDWLARALWIPASLQDRAGDLSRASLADPCAGHGVQGPHGALPRAAREPAQAPAALPSAAAGGRPGRAPPLPEAGVWALVAALVATVST